MCLWGSPLFCSVLICAKKLNKGFCSIVYKLESESEMEPAIEPIPEREHNNPVFLNVRQMYVTNHPIYALAEWCFIGIWYSHICPLSTSEQTRLLWLCFISLYHIQEIMLWWSSLKTTDTETHLWRSVLLSTSYGYGCFHFGETNVLQPTNKWQFAEFNSTVAQDKNPNRLSLLPGLGYKLVFHCPQSGEPVR